MSSGGSSQPTNTTVTQNTIPAELMPFATELLGKAQSLTSAPYQQYTGQQTAEFNPLQTQGYQQTQQLAPSGFTNQAGALSGIGATNTFNNAAAQQYMSPYMQNVVDVQKNQAINDYQRSIPGMNASAARSGGLGGTRNALMRSEAQRNLGNQLSNIQATGSQNAFQNAQNQYNQAQGQLFQGANLMGQMGSQAFNQNLGTANANLSAGNALQQQQQGILNSNMQNFYNQQNFPYQQLGFMSGLIRGTPTNNMTSSVYQAPMNPLQMGIGAATTLAGIGRKAGGSIRAEDSGIAGLFKAG